MRSKREGGEWSGGEYIVCVWGWSGSVWGWSGISVYIVWGEVSG